MWSSSHSSAFSAPCLPPETNESIAVWPRFRMSATWVQDCFSGDGTFLDAMTLGRGSHHAAHAGQKLIRLLFLILAQRSIEIGKRGLQLPQHRDAVFHGGEVGIEALNG